MIKKSSSRLKRGCHWNKLQQHLVERLMTMELTKLAALDILIIDLLSHRARLWIALKPLLSVIVVDNVTGITCHLQESRRWNGGRGVDMVDRWLWHIIKCFKHLTFLHFVHILLEVVYSAIILLARYLISELYESLIRLELVLGEPGL